MIKLPFTKMHGLGNSFILMDDRSGCVGTIRESLERLAKAVCDRNFGIGADGLILVRNSDAADFEMRIFNEDGSEAEMCGNGIRCFARYVIDEGFIDLGARKLNMAHADSAAGTTHESPLRIETLAGIKETRLLENGDVEVDMGEPVFYNDDVVGHAHGPIIVEEQGIKLIYISMGNPHAVTFIDDLNIDWRTKGAAVETSPSFPNKTNVEFVKVLGSNEAIVKVWERGCGETMACGTGACAVAVAGALTGRFPREPIKLHLPGGLLSIHWKKSGHILMTGPATTVCKGIYNFCG